eukprot:CAMPEP_0194288660 /NCGR_PEP_ID=MMETSP0169-20130528/37297_1 /TAXON_ID=218684 /ORGANISM="Corethron pennatum, Strain L29A3" /LENGTH=170 /DNA_ID=CAMNT_0039035719 /DNA_START=24 /DNA_END=539 /DNA_ORIENTATION=+
MAPVTSISEIPPPLERPVKARIPDDRLVLRSRCSTRRTSAAVHVSRTGEDVRSDRAAAVLLRPGPVLAPGTSLLRGGSPLTSVAGTDRASAPGAAAADRSRRLGKCPVPAGVPPAAVSTADGLSPPRAAPAAAGRAPRDARLRALWPSPPAEPERVCTCLYLTGTSSFRM